ncbi:hypothetical protein RRG08_014071 [Elysia crispata]|uniref:Uncharacterized protein n=1 Tax=Elysia crispata TaxID=231223 RepID=A0AAE0ZZG0_9GAST|nr:hypothetical protein RRG08_014071 [Elysia crispata]
MSHRGTELRKLDIQVHALRTDWRPWNHPDSFAFQLHLLNPRQKFLLFANRNLQVLIFFLAPFPISRSPFFSRQPACMHLPPDRFRFLGPNHAVNRIATGKHASPHCVGEKVQLSESLTKDPSLIRTESILTDPASHSPGRDGVFLPCLLHVWDETDSSA